MAHYATTVRTPMSVDAAFSYIADIRNFENWDPGVVSSVQTGGDGPGADATYDVTVRNGGREQTLHYEVTRWDPPNAVTIVGTTPRLTSIDVVTVEGSESGTLVTYDATLKLSGLMKLLDPLLDLAFQRIGDKAADGLQRVLEGEIVS